jgi:hypothetical protein
LNFETRWLIAVAAGFLLFPVIYVLWIGPDDSFGYVGGMLLICC